jgi:hypothetical protein
VVAGAGAAGTTAAERGAGRAGSGPAPSGSAGAGSAGAAAGPENRRCSHRYIVKSSLIIEYASLYGALRRLQE